MGMWMLLNHFETHRSFVLLNCFGIIMCLFMSGLIDEHALTSTSCGPLTHNVIGTISAANGIYPIGLIWQGIEVITVGERLMNNFCCYRFLSTKYKHQKQGQGQRMRSESMLELSHELTLVCCSLESVFLLLIAVIPSNEYLEVHCTMFLGFALFAFIGQFGRLWEFKLCAKHSPEIAKAYKRIKRIFLLGSILLFTAILFSFLHFVSCVSGAYSLFAAFEYLYVLYGNIYFHYRALSSMKELNKSNLFTISSKLVFSPSASSAIMTSSTATMTSSAVVPPSPAFRPNSSHSETKILLDANK